MIFENDVTDSGCQASRSFEPDISCNNTKRRLFLYRRPTREFKKTHDYQSDDGNLIASHSRFIHVQPNENKISHRANYE